MAAEKTSTSFRQFEFCSLCKFSHTKRKKHIYSKYHQQILNNILKKFSLKISNLKQLLFSPHVQAASYEKGAKFCCYFCTEEYNKHSLMENCTVIGAGLLEHIASDMHKENMVQFFWDNLLNKKLKPKFILSPEDLYIFKKACFLAVKKWQKAKEMERKQIAETITRCESTRLLCSETRYNQSESTSTATRLIDLPGYSGHHSESKMEQQGSEQSTGKRTVSAHAPGLTCIIQQSKDDGIEGNVHTGATPPWLQMDTPSNQSQEIGPTMTDLQKHLEREKKAKLPSTRVGAKFDHKAETSQDWLPSFGRVWSKGRRLQSKLHFEKQWKGDNYKGKSRPPVPSSTAAVCNGRNDSDGQRKDFPDSSDSQNSCMSKKYFSKSNPYSEEESGLSHDWKSSTPSGFPAANQIIPYKRKNHREICEPSGTSSSNQIAPYKRKRFVSCDNQNTASLLQTPLLANHQF